MSEGKVNMALCLLADDSKGGVLSLDLSIHSDIDSLGNPVFRPVRDILSEKHPYGRDPPPHVLLDCTTKKPCHDPVIFQCLTSEVIKRAAIKTHGAAGPSGVDACVWRRMCTSFGDASVSLCDSLSFVACRLSTVTIDSAILMPFVAYRLIPLDKRPGVCPIGIGDVPRQIIAKAQLVMMLYLLQVLCRLVLDMLLDRRLQFMPCEKCFVLLIVKLPYWWMLLMPLIPSTVRLRSIMLQYSALLCQLCCIIPTVLCSLICY